MFEENPWLKFYEPHVPEHIDYPPTTLPAALEETARKYPDHPAMIFKDNTISYREYNEVVGRFAAALQGLGVEKGDRVAIYLPNCLQFPIAYYAILRIGGIVVPCNPVYTAREMKHQLDDSGAEVIVTLGATYPPIIKQIRSDTNLRHVIVVGKQEGQVAISGDANTYWFADVQAEAPAKPQPVEIAWDDTAVLMYTGGTTGVSKGA